MQALLSSPVAPEPVGRALALGPLGRRQAARRRGSLFNFRDSLMASAPMREHIERPGF